MPRYISPQVQLAMHELLLGEGEHELRPYDGSSGSFLERMRFRLRLGAKEIHERKFCLMQQAERRGTFAEDTQGLSTAAVVALRAQLDADFPALGSCRCSVSRQTCSPTLPPPSNLPEVSMPT